MSKRMLIDGNYEEEIRVVVASGSQLEEYDIQTAFRKQIKSNIYLATVARVEPSLQAAFVDYGGSRHGFLPFNDVHPDYYQIPVEDRRKLLEEQEALDDGARAAREHLEEIDGDSASDDLEVEQDDGPADAAAELDGSGPDEDEDEDQAPDAEFGDADSEEDGESDSPVGAADEAASATPNRRRYKIQEVIKPGQILLVQILKEERGNKGAALTTYISLPGRYCVLMPNASRTGGISRRITDSGERRKLRKTLSALEIPDGMGLIIRTAGMQRSKSEIKRDLEYLLRAWDQVREVTMSSTAPCLVYEEGDIIKRSIRDAYTKDIDTVLVEGDEVYKNTKKFMRLLMPSHAKRVQRHDEDGVALFQRHQIEQQLEAMYRPEVKLKSGGSLVINQTEALVAIDVNSGRSTSERNTEKTALKTNLEAAEEVARQLRLRDLAGLIVIDFIDMDENRNVRKVERRMREVVKDDRARLKMSRISEFGLMELSRQRLRPSLIESSGETCRHCEGSGYVLSTESMALRVLRAIEQEAARRRQEEIAVFVPTEVALYILNHKRTRLVDIESRHGLKIVVRTDDSGAGPDVRIEQMPAGDGAAQPAQFGKRQASRKRQTPAKRANGAAGNAEDSADGARRSGRKRGRRRKNEAEPAKDEQVAGKAAAAGESGAEANGSAGDAEKPADGARRSGRRRGRRRRSEDEPPREEQVASQAAPVAESPPEADGSGDEGDKQPAARRRRRRRRKAANGDAQADTALAADGAPAGNGEAAEIDAAAATPPDEHPQPAPAPESPPSQSEAEDARARDEHVDKAARRGWWQKEAG